MATFEIEKGMAVVEGSEARDTINLVNPIGNGIVINANTGSDIIKVFKGDNHIINAGADNDYIEVSGGKYYIINLGEGDDTLKIYGDSGHKVMAVSGLNNITINNGSEMEITGGTGVDRLVLKGTNSNNKANLGEGDDLIGLATGIGNVLHAGEGNDQIIISGTGGESNTFYGDGGNDRFKIYAGINNTYYAGAGDDSILITTSSNNTIYGGTGKNQVMFMGGAGNVYYGGDTKDNITIKSQAQAVTVNSGKGATVINIQAGNDHILNLGDGDSVIQMLAGYAVQIKGGAGKDNFRAWGTVKNLNADFGAGNDTIKVEGGTYMMINGGAGDDLFNILNGKTSNMNNTFEGGDGNDTFIVTGGSNNKLLGGNGDDKFEIYRNNQNITLGYGNDVVNVYEGSYQKIKGNLGTNQINLFAGAYHTLIADIDTEAGVEAGCGVDKVLVDGATQITANLGDGEDEVELRSGSIHHIYTESGEDTVRISGPVSNSYIYLGDGDDMAYIEGGTNNTINGNQGKDTLVINGGKDNVINAGEDDDLIILNGGEVPLVDLGSGNDCLQINGGYLATLKLNKGNNSVVGRRSPGANFGTINLIKGTPSVDNLTISGQVNIDSLELESSKDTLTVLDDGVHISKVTVGRGGDLVILKGGSIDEIVFGSESEYLELAGIKNFKTSLLAGDDIIKVTDGYGLEIYGGLGKDHITVEGGKDSLLLGEEGDDIITVAGGSEIVVKSGLGKDTLTLTGGTKAHLYGDEDNDIITVAGGSEGIIEAGEGDDTLTLSDGQNHTVLGNTGNNSFVVQGGQGWKLYGGNQDDLVQVKGGEVALVDLGEGKDLLKLENGVIHTVKASLGLDRVESTSGSINQVLGTAGDDEIELAGATAIDVVELGEGENTLYMRDKVNIAQLDLRTGHNTIEWYGGTCGRILSDGTLESAQRNHINIHNISKQTLELVGGGADIKLLDVVSTNVNLGDNEDVIRVKDGSIIHINCGLGNDLVEILGGKDVKVNGIGGQNTVYIRGGEEVIYRGSTLSEGLLGDTVDISGGKEITVEATIGNDYFAVSGGQSMDLKGGKGDDTFLVAGGDMVRLIGGEGNDTFTFQDLEANCSYIVDQSITGVNDRDYINIALGNRDDFKIKRRTKDVILTYTNGATITIKNWTKTMGLSLQFSDSEALTWQDLFDKELVACADSQLDVMLSFMGKLNKTTKNSYAALDEAVAFSSQGRFSSFTALVNEFKQKILDANLSQNTDIAKFYEENCGIIFNNADTGSIVGTDCGGSEVRDKISIVQEPKGTTIADFVYDNSNTIVIDSTGINYTAATNNGVTYYWVDRFFDDFQVSREICEQIIGGLVNVWGPAAWELVEEATGLSMDDDDCLAERLEDGTVAMQVFLEYTPNGSLASMYMYNSGGYITNLLSINTYYFAKLMKDVNGEPSSYSSTYMDRLLAHEFTHAACYSNINNMGYMPKFFTEGLAELTQGIDDFRTSSLYDLARTSLRITDNYGRIGNSQKDSLDIIFDLTNSNTKASNTMSYCGGYALLRYYAKQVADYASSMALSGSSESYDLAPIEEKDMLKITSNR